VFELVDTSRTKLKDTKTPLSEPDRPEQITAATNWLINEAPEAIEGAGGDATTFEVACRVKDFGVTKETCFELMGDHWNNDKAHPPWNGEDLEQKVINAYAYGSLPPGISDPRGEFGALPPELVASVMTEAPISEGERLTTSETDWRAPTLLDADFDFGSIPPRQWIVDKFLCRGFVTGLISAGGVGKTQLAAALTVAIPAGRSDTCGMKIKEPVKTWYWNQEDNTDEMMRRVGAVVQKYVIDRDAIRGKVHINSGVENQLMLSRRKEGAVMRSADVPVIIRHIEANDIGVFIIDPLVEFHEADENSNPEMKKVVGYARDIATATGCAVLIVVHSKKPSQGSSDAHVGEAESARGASAQTNIFRIAYTFHTLSKKDAKNWGVEEKDAHLYARLDNAKANLFLGGGDPIWYKRLPVVLGLPDGDIIGVMDPVTLSAKRGETDIVELVAKALAQSAAFSRGAFYPLSEVLEKMPEKERGAFGEESNRSRLISKALTGPGWIKADDKYVGDTQSGRLTIIKKVGRGGYQFSLDNPTRTEATVPPAELVNSSWA
jgi:hypothetical protein